MRLWEHALILAQLGASGFSRVVMISLLKIEAMRNMSFSPKWLISHFSLVTAWFFISRTRSTQAPKITTPFNFAPQLSPELENLLSHGRNFKVYIHLIPIPFSFRFFMNELMYLVSFTHVSQLLTKNFISFIHLLRAFHIALVVKF